MERKIGEIFKNNGEWYQCVKSPDGSCKHCDMNFGGKCPIPIKECVAGARSDLSYVIFKKLEKVGEPYTDYCPSGRVIYFQRYKCYQTPAIPKETIIHWAGDISVSIEIEQNKEDMEESVKEKLFCDKVAKANAEYMKIKLNSSLKPFDLEAAKAGAPVCTRDGHKARIICFDKYCVENNATIVACVTSYNSNNQEFEDVIIYKEDGTLYGHEHPLDLMMLPEKHEGWINIIGKPECDRAALGRIYKSREEAVESAHHNDICIATVKIEWEE